VAWDEAFPGSHEWDEGANAAKDGIAVEECPYDEDLGKATDWLGGWNSVQVSA
jgi:ribosome modulation factor